ncbi:MAG: hypothetical protein KAG61_01540 [Bacteriovoracaceae bacterium]|nr:hypothetical protein [Bacteriovoracaceae bacterium]
MALNIKPLMKKDHPEVTSPEKPLGESDAAEEESKKDYKRPCENKIDQKDEERKKLKSRIKKKINPKRILRRLNII